MATREIAGVTIEIDDDGYMTDSSVWTNDIATAFAKEQGIEEFTDRHNIVIEFMRKEFEENGTGHGGSVRWETLLSRPGPV